MIDGYPAGTLRRIFSSAAGFLRIAAVRAAEAECGVLREVTELAQEASEVRARAQLAELENLREALGDQLTVIDEQSAQVEASLRLSEVMSAA